MLAEEEHFRQEMFAPDNDVDHVAELDLSHIRAEVEASLSAVGAQVAAIETAMTRAGRATAARHGPWKRVSKALKAIIAGRAATSPWCATAPA
jgi:hypothetical protein